MSNAFAAKRMAQVQIPTNRVFGRDFSMAQGYAKAMEKTLDLMDSLEEVMSADGPVDVERMRRVMERFKEKQYQAPPVGRQ